MKSRELEAGPAPGSSGGGVYARRAWPRSVRFQNGIHFRNGARSVRGQRAFAHVFWPKKRRLQRTILAAATGGSELQKRLFYARRTEAARSLADVENFMLFAIINRSEML